MTTAGARTNAVGKTISGIDSAIGGNTCKTDQFKIETASRGVTVFPDPAAYLLMNRDATTRLGDLLHHNNNNVQLIAQLMFENGIGLTRVVGLYYRKDTKLKDWEIRTKTERFKAASGRVYVNKL